MRSEARKQERYIKFKEDRLESVTDEILWLMDNGYSFKNFSYDSSKVLAVPPKIPLTNRQITNYLPLNKSRNQTSQNRLERLTELKEALSSEKRWMNKTTCKKLKELQPRLDESIEQYNSFYPGAVTAEVTTGPASSSSAASVLEASPSLDDILHQLKIVRTGVAGIEPQVQTEIPIKTILENLNAAIVQLEQLQLEPASATAESSAEGTSTPGIELPGKG